jgi:hypothetical protein
VRLVEPDDILEKMIYALTNPVKDPLVEHVWEWPGVNSYGASIPAPWLISKQLLAPASENRSCPSLAKSCLAAPT